MHTILAPYQYSGTVVWELACQIELLSTCLLLQHSRREHSLQPLCDFCQEPLLAATKWICIRVYSQTERARVCLPRGILY